MVARNHNQGSDIFDGCHMMLKSVARGGYYDRVKYRECYTCLLFLYKANLLVTPLRNHANGKGCKTKVF